MKTVTIKPEIKALNLTPMEEFCLQVIIDGLYAEMGFSDVDARDVADLTGINIKSVRGVLSSLIKKGIIYIDDNGAGYQIIYLYPSFYYIHSQEWVDDYKEQEWRYESYKARTATN